MNTANFITASAVITRVTELKKGDVYKRLEDSTYSTDKLKYGIVIDVLYNGEDAVVQTMEFNSSYSSLETTFEIFSNEKDLKIFPATQEDLKQHLANCVEQLSAKVETKKEEATKAEADLAKAKDIVSGSLVKKLTTPSFTNEKIAIEA